MATDCPFPSPRSHTASPQLLSVDPANYSDAPTEGIRRILEQGAWRALSLHLPPADTVETETGLPHPRGVPLDTSRLLEIRMGTTVATNALLERTGERTCLVTTAGFKDLLHIGTQSRPRIFDLEVVCPSVLYETVVEVDELVSLPLGSSPSIRDGLCTAPHAQLLGRPVTGTTGEALVVRKAPDLAAVRAALAPVLASGVTSLAVCFKHSFLYPDHELAVGALATAMGFTQVSLSSVVLPAVKMVPRGFTAMADAYLTPHILRYLAAFTAGFDCGVKAVRLSFMQSDGGLSSAAAFSGHRAILSGPAGGVVGYAATTAWRGTRASSLQMVGFDMGGTSTDVSRVANGLLEHVFESTTAGVTIAAPQLDVNTVAAGGGSKLTFRNGIFVVGPESVGAHPGPVCYRKGGQLAVTDANLQLGRIVPSFFPQCFGPGEDGPLDADATRAAFAALTATINGERAEGAALMSEDGVAAGFVRVANEAMCRPIRALTNMKGYDAAAHVLACFGGAGGQHCCAIARALGMRTVFVHRYASVLSALGIGLAATVFEAREPAAGTLSDGPAAADSYAARFAALERTATQALMSQGFQAADVSCERYLNLRYEGTDVAMMTLRPADGDYAAAFVDKYRREFGFTLQRPLIVDDLRVRASAAGAAAPDGSAAGEGATAVALPEPAATVSAFFDATGRVPTPVYRLADLPPGAAVPGPALLLDAISSVVVEPRCTAFATPEGNLRIDVQSLAPACVSLDESQAVADPIQLSIFGHRFMGIAEQMGRTLQRTSVSVNIKERLDFSCALFGPDGGLVANAPHLPVHLGAMQEAVRFQLSHCSQPGSEALEDGDVLVSNHPQLAGGSHLPDITVITPVFDAPGPHGRLVFFVASRGHHADIGGISPGSMPPRSTSLSEEGAAIVSFRLVRRGVLDEAGITALLQAPGLSGVEGCSGTRGLADNLSDLKAQTAANTRGIVLVRELIAEHGLRTVQSYMFHIRAAAERAVRQMLTRFSAAQGLPVLGTVRAEDRLDDGTPIALVVTIDRDTGSAVFDFEGTGPEVHGNLNAPPAVTYSAVIYALRCLVREDIPLNQGCLAPITFRIPPGSLLHPSATAAVVGGNVLTSQRVTDVVLKCFGAAAASQGCMNNTTFGDEGLGYYETVCGGAGAGPGFHGRSGVHTHMTNTRITDPEILERRYPVVLRRFALRPGSGGAGNYRGGDGVVREMEVCVPPAFCTLCVEALISHVAQFLRPLTVGILSERRALAPFGLAGGCDGLRGVNLWLQAPRDAHMLVCDPVQRTVSLGGKATVLMLAGDRLRLLTPGGGGYGAETEEGVEGRAATTQQLRDGGSLDAYKEAQEGV